MTTEEQNAELSKIYDSIPEYEPTDDELQKMYNNFKRNNTIMKNKTKKGLMTSPKTVTQYTNNNSLNIAKKHARQLGITDEVNFLIKHKDERVCVLFEKKDRSQRKMTFVPNNGFNAVMGRKDKGKGSMVQKAEQGMITVAEIVTKRDASGAEFETFQPRTANLTTVIDYFVVGSDKEVA